MAGFYTVEQVNRYIRNLFEQDFLLENLSVKGEVSNCKYHTSGHLYFSLKDGSGVLSCVMFAGRRNGLPFRLENGQKVIVSGNIDVYERDGKYQLYAEKIEKEGIGELYKRYLALKDELEQMGMFAKEYKRPIPRFAQTVGVVTARTGAVIQDILNVSHRRNPYVRLVLYPVKVQGEGAALSIAEGIAALDRMGVDVMIIGRGGGSIEDLWAFNEEIVARAIFACQTPVISAVGHETDYTIADFVADLRAPTPSAAAELAVFEYAALEEYLQRTQEGLLTGVHSKIRRDRKRLSEQEWRLRHLSPENMLNAKRQRVADAQTKLTEQLQALVKDRRQKLTLLSERLNGLSPLTRLSGGYAYVSGEDDRGIVSVDNINERDKLQIYVKDGRISAEVTAVEKKEPGRQVKAIMQDR